MRTIPASTRIHADLREQIISMKLLPGSPVSEKELSEAYGVSRTPVREAILRVADERLIDIWPHYGTFVSRINPGDLRDAMVIREALERVAAREAARKRTQQHLDEIGRQIEMQRLAHKLDDPLAFYTADEAFHAVLAEAAGHPNLWRVVRQEKAQVDRCRFLTLPSTDRRTGVIAEHGLIVAAIKAGDPEAADKAMAKHLGEVLPSFDQLMQSHPEYFETGVGALRRQRTAVKG